MTNKDWMDIIIALVQTIIAVGALWLQIKRPPMIPIDNPDKKTLKNPSLISFFTIFDALSILVSIVFLWVASFLTFGALSSSISFFIKTLFIAISSVIISLTIVRLYTNFYIQLFHNTLDDAKL